MADTPTVRFEPKMMIDGKLVDGEAGTFTNINPATEEALGEVADASKDGHAPGHRRGPARVRRDRLVDQPRVPRKRACCNCRTRSSPSRRSCARSSSSRSGCPRAITYGPQLDAPLADGLQVSGQADRRVPVGDRSLGDAVDLAHRREHHPQGLAGAGRRGRRDRAVELPVRGHHPTSSARRWQPATPSCSSRRPNTPFNATRLGRLIAEKTDIPAGVVNVVTASDHFVGEELTLSPKVDLISFTGSTVVGKRIMEKGAATMKRLFLELGGKSATIVLEDADFALGCMIGIAPCMHAGQGCANPTRMLLPRSRYDEGVEILKGIYESVAPGDPQDPGHAVRPGHLRQAAQPHSRLHPEGRRRGRDAARRRTRARRSGFDKGYFVRPTLFTDVDNSMTIAQEEIFGPVLVGDPVRRRGRRGADRQRQPVRACRQRHVGIAGPCAGGGQAAARRLHRPQRHGGLRRRHAVRRIQGQRRRTPERHRRLRPVHGSEVRGLPGR